MLQLSEVVLAAVGGSPGHTGHYRRSACIADTSQYDFLLSSWAIHHLYNKATKYNNDDVAGNLDCGGA